MKAKTKVLIVVVVIIGLGLIAKSAVDDLKAAADAYLYGYPLVIMEETRKAGESIGGANVLGHNREFPDGDFRFVVRPNFDTLYTSAAIDLKDGPQVVSMPDTGDRYYVLPFMDAWTNVFASTGTSTTGNGRQEVVLTGPDYTGELPEDLTTVVESPTNMVWMIGRVQTNGANDVAAVATIQNQMALTPLTDWINGERKRGTTIGMADAQVDVDPMTIVDKMDAQTYFSSLNHLMAEQPPLKDDGPELAKFAHLGIAPGMVFQMDNLGWLQAIMVQMALDITRGKMSEAMNEDRSNAEGWNVIRSSIGVYGTDYPMRAVVAKFGLGALPPNEASYPSCLMTPDKELLDGSKYNYRLHFSADQLPPVDAFWSLTLYDFEGFMKHNEIDRYSIGDRSDMQFNEDGSLDIYIQHKRPESGVSNWLPAPQEEFNVILRLYLPKDKFTSGEWIIPPFEKVKAL